MAVYLFCLVCFAVGVMVGDFHANEGSKGNE